MLRSAQKLDQRTIEKKPTRHGYGDAIAEIGEKNTAVVVLTADLSESTRSHIFAKKFPERFIEVGIAEQNMAGISAGLALSGKIPFMTSYSIFSPGLNWLTIRTSICYSQANVKIVSTHSGFSDGGDGATHQALEDIALTRVLPNMVVLAPADYYEAKKAVYAAVEHKGPVYIRLSREATPVFTTEDTPFGIGKAQILMDGKDITVIACGPLVYKALEAAQSLVKNGVECEVINCPSIKPLDEVTILTSVEKTKKVVTIEEHQINGGLGSAICELLSDRFPVQVKRLGAMDTFGESGKYEELLGKYGLSTEKIIQAILVI